MPDFTEHYSRACIAELERLIDQLKANLEDEIALHVARIADEAVARRERIQSANAKEPQPANEPAEERQRKVWTGEELYELFRQCQGDTTDSFAFLADIINGEPSVSRKQSSRVRLLRLRLRLLGLIR